MRALPHPRSHPRRGDRFRSMLAQWSLLSLLAAFLGLLCLFAAILALLYYLYPDQDSHSYWFWLRESVLLLSGLATGKTQHDEATVPRAVAQVAGALGALIIPALVLGTVVFKGFVKDRVFVTRSHLALLVPGEVNLPSEGVEYWLAFRIYSRTRLQLVNLRFEAYARVPGRNPTKEKIVTNVQLRLEKAHWPVALTHIPYTLYTPLKAGDIEWAGNTPRLARVKDLGGTEHDLTKGCDILLTVTGSIPELGTDLIESHWFRGVELTVGRFGEISPDYPPDLKTWKVSGSWPGWTNFDA
jgi:hypothetical protein